MASFNDHSDFHRRAMERADKDRERRERRTEAAYERLRFDLVSIAQQFTGISVTCTFIASMTIALINLAFDMFQAQTTNEWTRTNIYTLWYLALIYGFTIAIASGACAVFAFAHANGHIDAQSVGRIAADRDRMSRLIVGFAACFGLAVIFLFLGLLLFIWDEHDRTVTVLVGITTGPLWLWVMLKIYMEWTALSKWEAMNMDTGKRIWYFLPKLSWISPKFSWLALRQRKKDAESEGKRKKESEKESV